MKRAMVFTLVLLAVMLVPGTPAFAGEKWCAEDPVLTIDGRTVNYTASFPLSNLSGATVSWTFHIPKNVILAAAITPPALGSPTIPTTVRIVRDLPTYFLLGKATVITTVTITGSGSFATSTAVQGLNARWTTYLGHSNTIQSLSTAYSLLPLLY